MEASTVQMPLLSCTSVLITLAPVRFRKKPDAFVAEERIVGTPSRRFAGLRLRRS